MKNHIIQCKNLAEISTKASEFIIEKLFFTSEEKGIASIALSGGSTPKELYKLIAIQKNQLDWSKIHIFWGDERVVLKNNAESNFNLAYKSLVSKLDIPERNIHRIKTELTEPKKIAKNYEETLKRFFENKNKLFDIIILGIGADGHTASLFPGHEELKENSKLVIQATAPSNSPIHDRITLTLSAINQSEDAIFLAAGEEKIKIFNEIIEDQSKTEKRYPAAMVNPKNQITWFIAEKN